MAEPTDPENPKHPDPAHSDPDTDTAGEQGGEGDEGDEEENLDPDLRTGFSAEQRRFLWTLTGLNVVAILLGAAVVVIYLSTARSQDQAIVRLSDASHTADITLQRTTDQAMPRLMFAKHVGDKDASITLEQQVYDACSSAVKANVAWRSARGLPVGDPSQSIEEYMNGFNAELAENMRRQFPSTQPTTTQSSTEPATNPAATMPAATMPAAVHIRGR